MSMLIIVARLVIVSITKFGTGNTETNQVKWRKVQRRAYPMQAETPSNSRNIKKLQTREHILDCARKLFFEKGFEDTTTREIAEVAGIASGTLFAHFSDKHELLVATLHHNIEEVLAGAYSSLDRHAPAVDQFLHIITGLYQFYLQNRPLSRVLLQNGLFHSGDQKSMLDEQIQAFITFVSQLIQHAQQTGEISNNLDHRLIAENFMAAYFYCLIGGIRDKTISATQLVEKLRLMLTQQLSS